MFSSNRKLGKGFFPRESTRRYFDKNKFLTLGSGDPFYECEDHEIIDGDEDYSKFLSILTTLIFFTDPSESNVIWLNTNLEKVNILSELFPDYIFYVNSHSHGYESENEYIRLYPGKEILSTMNPIIFVDDILEMDSTVYEELNPYLIMGNFEPETNIYFFDGILLRPIFGEKPKLMVKGMNYRHWDIKNLQKMLNHHIQIVRKDYKFFDPVDGSRTNSNYDQTARRYILSKYLTKVNLDVGNVDDLERFILQEDRI